MKPLAASRNRPMPSNSIELVCFDLGRVFVRICDGWPDACRIAGVKLPSCLTNHTALEQITACAQRHELGRISDDEFMLQMAAMTGLSAREVAAVSDAWLTGAFAGVADLIDAVQAVGVRTACLSNTNANHWRIMTTSNGPNRLPLERLTYRFASHLIGIMKPDAGIYEHVEKHAALPGDSIVFFDDHPPNVASAMARGWRAVLVTPDRDPVELMAAELRRLGVL